MILVDSSVWITRLRGNRTLAVEKLEIVAARERLLVGDLILLEILQGARDGVHARRIERELRMYPIVSMLDGRLASRAARNYRVLRGRGITIRKTVDIIIGTFCIEHGYALLHDDRDFAAMEAHLGLKVI